MLDSLIINATSIATASVIWMHGLGADGHDFEPVIHMLKLPHVRFVLPHAPYRPVTINNGYEMRAWYDIMGLTPDSSQDEAGIREMQSEINALIAHEIALGIPPSRIVLAGFSQGGAMALQTATRYPQPLAGVLALSTYLPISEKLSSEKNSANLHTPIFMVHGDHDAVIQPSRAEFGRDKLIQEGFDVTWKTYDMPHSVIEPEIADIRAFLRKVLPE